jgi:outer membrane protein assembly factor BamB
MLKFSRFAIVVAVMLITGCSSLNPFSKKAPRNDPAPLTSFKTSMSVQKVWSNRIGKSDNYFFNPAVVADKLYAASADGTVACMNVSTGKMLWRINAAKALTAGVGSDGKTVVVVATDGLVLAFDAITGKNRWKAQASSDVLSTPAVGGGVVVLRSLDNRILALDAQSGTRRWFVQRPAPTLALRAAPGILIDDDFAYVALPAGRLIALALTNGGTRWDAAVVEPRGATELERVVDLSGTPVISGRDICVTAYQGRVVCADLGNGALRWARELSAEAGVGVDDRFVYAADDRGNVNAFARTSGASQWRNTALALRHLSAPTAFGRAVAVGDYDGYIHFLSREDGAMLARLSTDGSSIKAAPIVVGSRLIVQTDDGQVLAIATK